MAGAIQARINMAIEARLRADTLASSEIAGVPLAELLRAQGAILGQSSPLPLMWSNVPMSQPRPYLVYRAGQRESSVEPLRCGRPGLGQIRYEVGCVVDDIKAGNTIAIIDRITDLLAGYVVEVDGATVSFLYEADVLFPDLSGAESGVTHSGVVFLAQVRFQEE